MDAHPCRRLTLLGFPIALLLAWAFDITPEGVKRTEPESPEPVAPGKVERVPGEGDTEACKSIAVLPFADMSPEGGPRTKAAIDSLVRRVGMLS